MALTFTFGNIVVADVTTVRNEINRIRAKHSLTAFTFSATDAFPRATIMQELKTQISGIDASSWIPDGSINVTSIPTFAAGTTKVQQTDLSSMASVLNTVDAICANNSNYTNYGDYSDYVNNTNNPNYSDNPNLGDYTDNPNNSVNSDNANYTQNSKPGW